MYLAAIHCLRSYQCAKPRWVYLITGTEVFQGLVQDSFERIISMKLKRLGCQEFQSLTVPDDQEVISRGVRRTLRQRH
ncbi:MAG: hypothetical protein D4R45_04210 [Planctomycetaceae bacterium]|nr:MAG: hypothetical protein D4R45_04210 [Planctomycetaceae bacterium]